MSRHHTEAVFPGGARPFIYFLTFIGAFAPLSTDLYLPAMPAMTAQFHAGPELMGLTISGFLFCFALSMPVWGPFSDKYGRRPVLLAGAALYIVSCVVLALTDSLAMLIFWRCAQGVGSGALSTVSLALVKDVFRGAALVRVVALVQTMHVLAPMLAPVLGGALLMITSWRGVFWVQACCGALALAGGWAQKETLRHPLTGSPLDALLRVPFVLSDRGFRHLLLLFSAAVMPFMAYLGISAYVFQAVFDVSPQQFSLFFAANAAVSMLGPLCHMRVFHVWNRRRFIAGSFLTILAGGIALIVVGDQGPFWFALCFLPITFAGSAVRPPSTVLMMRQLSTDTGTVSSLIGSAGLLCGSLSMTLCAASFWPDYITAAAVISCTVGAVGFGYWLWLDRTRAFRT
ncbi:MAG: MFS transporter [Desulfovibrionaceae bacterium]|nr:MFS transporter [Desulfovibrionaceae bacterium]